MQHDILDILGHGSKRLDILGHGSKHLDILGLDILGLGILEIIWKERLLHGVGYQGSGVC